MRQFRRVIRNILVGDPIGNSLEVHVDRRRIRTGLTEIILRFDLGQEQLVKALRFDRQVAEIDLGCIHLRGPLLCNQRKVNTRIFGVISKRSCCHEHNFLAPFRNLLCYKGIIRQITQTMRFVLDNQRLTQLDLVLHGAPFESIAQNQSIQVFLVSVAFFGTRLIDFLFGRIVFIGRFLRFIVVVRTPRQASIGQATFEAPRSQRLA